MSKSDLRPLTRFSAYRVKIAALALLAHATLCAQAADPQFVAAQGRVVPAGGVIHVAASQDGGTPIIAKLFVNEGDTVKEGAWLAELTTLKVLREATDEARAQTHLAMQRINVAHQSATEIVQARMAAAKAEIDLAEKGLAEALAAKDTADKALVEADARTQAQQARLSGTWAENRRILDKDSPPAREAAQLRFEQKMLDLQKAELAATHAGTALHLQAQIAQAQTAVETAQQRVASAKAAYQIAKAEGRNAELSAVIAQSEHKAAAHAVAKAKELAKTATILAPGNGTVLRLNARPGEVVPQEGLLLLGDLSRPYFEAEVYIDDLRHVKIGQKARITGESFDGEILGTVERIGQIVELPDIFARDPASFTDRRVVRVRIRPDAEGDALPAPLPVHSRVLVRIER